MLVDEPYPTSNSQGISPTNRHEKSHWLVLWNFMEFSQVIFIPYLLLNLKTFSQVNLKTFSQVMFIPYLRLSFSTRSILRIADIHATSRSNGVASQGCRGTVDGGLLNPLGQEPVRDVSFARGATLVSRVTYV